MSDCKVCGHRVAMSAWECQNCGSQVPTAAVTVSKILLVGFFLVLLLWMYGRIA